MAPILTFMASDYVKSGLVSGIMAINMLMMVTFSYCGTLRMRLNRKFMLEPGLQEGQDKRVMISPQKISSSLVLANSHKYLVLYNNVLDDNLRQILDEFDRGY